MHFTLLEDELMCRFISQRNSNVFFIYKNLLFKSTFLLFFILVTMEVNFYQVKKPINLAVNDEIKITHSLFSVKENFVFFIIFFSFVHNDRQ